MSRSLHSVVALMATVLLVALSLSGAVLSVYPLAGKVQAPRAIYGQTVAELAGRLASQGVEVDSVTRAPSGLLTATYVDASGNFAQATVDAATGALTPVAADAGGFRSWMKSFHRSFLLGDFGRGLAGAGAAAMALMALSGIFLMIQRMGGVARVFDRPRGSLAQRLHTVVSRLVLVPLVVSALTGLYMTSVQFGLVTVTTAASQSFPVSTQVDMPPAPQNLAALQAVALAEMRSLKFPMAGDNTDVFTLVTASGVTVIDQGTGAVLEQVPATASQQVWEWVYALHTGDRLPLVGALLGLAALFVPLLGATGLLVWLRRRRDSRPAIAGNAGPQAADVVVLVGSEGGSTWGFARSLHAGLTSQGLAVHVASMNEYRHRYDRAQLILFLTATYGNGHAPKTANRFLARLAEQTGVPNWAFAVLGFGDRAFPQFCQFAKDLDDELEQRGWKRMLKPGFVNRQSSQAFATWGAELGAAMDVPLELRHEVEIPATEELELVSRQVYGADVQAPTAVLRFRRLGARADRGWQRLLTRITGGALFSPSDLLGVLPAGSPVPRYYSVASAPSAEEVEICVRKQAGGLCSGMLHDLLPGDRIRAFVRPNPDFVPPSRRKPVIMVAAGTGIAPFAGMIRANSGRQPFHLFWGGRNPESDFLFGEDLTRALGTHHLATLTTAFSRVARPAYVQDRLRAEAQRLAALVRQGAAIMVCGGDAMAAAVKAEFEEILAPAGLSVAALKARGQYLEDIF